MIIKLLRGLAINYALFIAISLFLANSIHAQTFKNSLPVQKAESTGILGKPTNSSEPIDNSINRIKLANSVIGLKNHLQDLSAPLALARAQACIAAAAWEIDAPWAMKSLREAYFLTLPTEEERKILRERRIGDSPKEPRKIDLARYSIQSFIFSVASHSPKFAQELMEVAKRELGNIEELNITSGLANEALQKNNFEKASEYINQAMSIDPTQTSTLSLIKEVRLKNNELADKLLLEYLNTLRNQNLSATALTRVYFILDYLIFPNQFLDTRKFSPVSADVIKSYLNYIVRSANESWQRDPESLNSLGGWLRKISLPIQQNTPDLLPEYSFLVGKLGASPFTKSNIKEETEINIKKRTEEAIKSGDSKALGREVSNAAFRGDFEKAHELLDLIQDKNDQEKYTEELNWRESLSLISRGKLIEAEHLAHQIKKAEFILPVYSALSTALLEVDKNQAITVIDEAITKLREADSPRLCLRFISQVIHPITVIDSTRAIELLSTMVTIANTIKYDNSLGELDFPITIFTDLPIKERNQVSQIVLLLRNPLQKIAVLSEIYRLELESTAKESK